MMLRHNVKVVFGYPGGAILPVYDAIYNSDYFDFVLPYHECCYTLATNWSVQGVFCPKLFTFGNDSR